MNIYKWMPLPIAGGDYKRGGGIYAVVYGSSK